MATGTRSKNSLRIAIAIVGAGALVATALFFSGRASQGLPQNPTHAPAGGSQAAERGAFRLPNTTEDHVRGDPDAPIAIVEFSDFECPFCARLHPTLSRIVAENSDVQWVYRHFPLSSIHSRALGAAVAGECVAKLGGNDAFWIFADAAFANQHRLGSDLYGEVAASVGIDAPAFNLCLKDRSVAAEVQDDGNEATQFGGRGTPFAVVVTASGTLAPFSGALPYEQVQSLVDQARTN